MSKTSKSSSGDSGVGHSYMNWENERYYAIHNARPEWETAKIIREHPADPGSHVRVIQGNNELYNSRKR